MGASSADLLAGGGRELVVPSWDGIVQIVERSSGAPLATYDVLAAHGEHLYGHAAIADITGDGSPEVVLVGHDAGRVIALSPDGSGGFGAPAYVGPALGSHAFGSGPAVGDIDGDGSPEIVVTLTNPPLVFAFDPADDTDCEYYWLPPAGGDYVWTSPVIGDVDGDGDNEVIAQANNGRLSVLSTAGADTTAGCALGAYEADHAVGTDGRSWFTPALADVTGGSAPEIVTASYHTLQIISLEGALSVTYEATESTATFYPSASVVNRAGAASVFVSGWSNGAVYRYDLDQLATIAWPTMMGGNARAGLRAAPDGDCSTCGGGACLETCAGGACECADPDCACALDCVDGNCDPTCLNGATCDISCAAGSSCTAQCDEASTCDVACDTADRCRLKDCEGGSTCAVTCDDTDKCESKCIEGSLCDVTCNGGDGQDCKATCETGSTCNVACDGVEKCDLHDCEDGSTCNLLCDGAEDCEAKCTDGSTCNMACSGELGDECRLDCKEATCDLTCEGVEDCDKVQCHDGSTCSVSCVGVTHCEIDCKGGSQCELTCEDSETCEFKQCDGAEMTCPDGRIVCNRGC
jgi:hypothetical protein